MTRAVLAAALAGWVGLSPGISHVSARSALLAASLANDLSGTWHGPLRHNGQASHFALRLRAEGESAYRVRASLPAIDAWDLPLGTATVVNDSIRLGSWVLIYDDQARTLSGELPSALAPVHRIPFVLARTDSLERSSVAFGVEEVLPAEPVWTETAGSPIWAGVAFDDGRVYAGSDDGRLRALRAADGAVLWTFETAGSIRARPTVDRESVYVVSDDGHLYKLRRDDGTQTWRARLLQTPRERVPPGTAGSRYDHFAGAPRVVEGTIYLGAADGRAHALATDSGEVLWSYQSGDAIDGSPAVQENRVFFGSFDGRVYCLDALSGELVWSFDTQAPVVSSPAVAADKVFIGSRSYDFFALDAATGEPAWKHYLWFSWVESSAVVAGGTVYVGSSDAQLMTALSTATGDPLWERDLEGSAWAQPAVDDSFVYIGTVGVAGYIVDHRGAFFSLDRRTGAIRWRFESARPSEAALWGFASSPAVGDGMVFVGGLDGTIYAFPSEPLAAD